MTPQHPLTPYTQFAPQVPVRRVTDGVRPAIHRFFDSDPISPCGRYLAVTEFAFDDRLPEPGDPAHVVVIDLESGGEVYRRQTLAWDTQLGAQCQWGATSSELFFNDLKPGVWKPFGLCVDITSGGERRLEGTVYHVSPDGRWVLSPDLTKIGIAQAGYGVHVPSELVRRNDGAVDDDGIWITDSQTGQTRLLVSLKAIADQIAPGCYHAGEGECYAFHTKWNGDGSRIMLVLRWFPARGRAGRSQNWLVTLDASGGDLQVAVDPARWGDGHHPNWYPHGTDIVMNLPAERTLANRLRILAGKLARRAGVRIAALGVPLRFKQVSFDGRRVTTLSPALGSGHPSIRPHNGAVLSDAYLNEPMAWADGTVPVRYIPKGDSRVIDVIRIAARPDFYGPKGEWRIDPHPVWTADGNRLVFNGAHNGVRSVYVADFQRFDR